MKKGLSDIITTVLIILLVLAAVVIVWSFIRPAIKNAGEGIESDSLSTVLTVIPDSIAYNPSSKSIRFIVKRGIGGGEMVGFTIILEDSDGKSATFRGYESTPLKEFETVQVNITNFSPLTSVKKILLVPLIKNPQTGKIIVGKIPGSYVVSSASNSTVNTGSSCGNRIVDSGEQCDGNTHIINCLATQYGYYGTQTCNQNTCKWNNDCTVIGNPYCGDGVAQAGESCDGNDFFADDSGNVPQTQQEIESDSQCSNWINAPGNDQLYVTCTSSCTRDESQCVQGGA
ncbi:hypothetical protein KW787_00765 [Candidatus Pacearchaeota archaeon]|nr:hypothetical protein [Candidatus Pacearchaeota archaeon]